MLLICIGFNANPNSAFYLCADPNPTFLKILILIQIRNQEFCDKEGKNKAIFSVLPTWKKKAAMTTVPFLCNYVLN
jgi:hypothetical protein